MKKFIQTLFLAGAILLAGCGDDRDEFVVTSGGQLVAPPTAVADTYTVNANTTLTVAPANSVLANDTVNGATLAFTPTTTNGGTIAGLADGTFLYTPKLDFFGNDTFTYTLANSGGTSTTTVTITVTAVNGYFVDTVNGNDTTGSFTNGRPFATIQQAVTVAGTGQDIVVRSGNYTGTVTLLDNQRLLGSGSSLSANTFPGATRPTLNSQIILANGNTVDFIRIDGVNDNGIVASNRNGGTITNCVVENLTNFAAGLQITSVTGNWTVSNNTFTNIDGVGVSCASDTGDNLRGVFHNNICTNNEDGAFGFTAGQNSVMRVQVTNNIMTGTINPGGTFQVITGGTADFAADITGNTNDDAYQTGRLDATSQLQIEQLSQLSTINSGGADLDVALGTIPPTEVADGFCGFPAP